MNKAVFKHYFGLPYQSCKDASLNLEKNWGFKLHLNQLQTILQPILFEKSLKKM